MIIFKPLGDIGEIEFDAYYEYCKNNKLIVGRYTQQADHSVYAVDGKNASIESNGEISKMANITKHW